MASQNNVSENVLLLDVRLRNANLATPFVGKNDKGETTTNYSVRALFAPGTPAHVALSAAIQKVAAAKWGAQSGAFIQEMNAANTLCLHDGATKASDPAFNGMKFVSASSKRQPTALISRQGANVKMTVDDPCYPYAGCWANVQLNIWPQEAKGQWPRRINAEVTAVQFLRHDEAFVGGAAAAVKLDEFPVVETAGADAAAPAAGGSLI